jgi:DNA repair exonuclease SbcCD ATPase subunit
MKAVHCLIKISEATQAIAELKQEIAKHTAHKNELISLSARWLRSKSARAVIEGVEFSRCPSCTLELPSRPLEICPVCGQKHQTGEVSISDDMAEKDLQSRTVELESLVDEQNKQLGYISRYLEDLLAKKRTLDDAITKASAAYDSSYLSAVLVLERRHSAINQQLTDLEKLEQLAAKILELQNKAEKLVEEEIKTRAALKLARIAAEKDTGNLNRLKELFLDCLVRSKIAGFLPSDIVDIRSPHFLPEVKPVNGGELAFTSFANIGSGGKKTLFKCCFALALHRLVNETGGLLPRFMIIDSPMKNISERENFEQFKGFHDLLYDLSMGELRGTQFILIDKEMFHPPEEFGVSFTERHMKPSDSKYPPLIGYYQGQ